MASEDVFRFNNLSLPGVRHGVTGRRVEFPDQGDVSYLTASTSFAAATNRVRWAKAIGIDPATVTTARQSHGVGVGLVDARARGRGSLAHEDGIADVDALITAEPGIALMAVAADCVPLLLLDPVRSAVGAVHAGWRGTVAGIAARVVAAMAHAFGTDPGDLLVGLGPSIGPCCYEVGAEVIEAWDQLGLDPKRRAVLSRQPRDHLDLWTANEIGLESAGVRAESIERAAICTRCHAERYFSRRSGIGHQGLFGAVIALEGGDQ